MTTAHGAFDDRIFHKEGKTLKKKYNVTLIAPHNGNATVDGIKIVALPKATNRFLRMVVLGAISFLFAIREKADVYHFHDPELLIIGLLLKIFTGKKIIYDVHEDYTAAIHDKYWLPAVARNSVARAFGAAENLCARAFFDGIIAATPEIARKFPSEKTLAIRNMPVYDMIFKTRPLNIKKEKPVMIYAGGLSEFRGIKEIIMAVGLLEGSVGLWLLGPWETEEFRRECEALNGWQYAAYHGVKSLKEVYGYMKAADMGVHCTYLLQRYQKALPVKYFEYLACGIPAILSVSAYWEELFHNCALFVDPQSPEDIAGNIIKLIQNTGLKEHLVANGRKLIEGEYNWETEGKTLLVAYEKLLMAFN